MPALSILQPENEATPVTALLGLAVQVSVAPAGEPVMLSVMGAVLVVTVRLELSWTETTGWVPKTVPPAAPDGDVVKPSLAAVPATVKDVLTALASGKELAVRV